VVDFLLVLVKVFSPSFTVEAQYADIGQNFGVRKGKEGHPPTTLGVRKLESLGYHVVLIVCVIPRLVVLIQ